jgi:hypothetical protein
MQKLIFSLSVFLVIFITFIIIAGCCPDTEPTPESGPEINIRQETMDLADGSGVFDFGKVTPDGDGGIASDYEFR